jgi:hypothetical protein
MGKKGKDSIHSEQEHFESTSNYHKKKSLRAYLKDEKITRREFARIMGMGAAGMALIPTLSTSAWTSSLNWGGGLHEIKEAFLKGTSKLPHSAKPWLYWMWLRGNITKEGITAGLEAMDRIGIGGSLMMDLGGAGSKRNTPDGGVYFMTPEWQEMVAHTIDESARLDLEFDLNNSEGWDSGGPWITPKLGLQKLTWSETHISGSQEFSGSLQPPSINLDTYTQIAVLAVPTPKSPVFPEAQKTVRQKPNYGLQLDYGKPVTARSLTMTRKGNKVLPRHCELWVSNDGKDFNKIKAFETGWFRRGAPNPVSFGIPSTKGRFFRLLMPDVKAILDDIGFSMGAEPCIDHWRIKAGFDYLSEHGQCSPLYIIPDTFPGSDEKYPSLDQVIDLSGMLDREGRLDWQAPPGDWLILNIGFTPTGKKIKEAAPGASGLESDRLNKKALETQLSSGMVDKIIQDVGPDSMGEKGLTTIHTDSFEAGPTNWTASFPKEFKERRGYDLTSWLPVMTGGHVIGSIEQSEQFLWDIRRTLADMIADNNLEYFRELCHKRGLKFSSESAGRGQYLYDPIFFQATSDLPMGECWNSPHSLRPRLDCKAAASAINIMGLPVAGAEIFTDTRNKAGRWLDSPFSLKAQGDLAFCFGINRYVFHRCILQPNPEEKPGLTWPGVGINFDPSNTWWNASGSYMDYLTRCQYLLQQGQFFADVAVLLDEGAPSSLVRPLKDPVDPHGKWGKEWDDSTITEGILRYFGRMPFLPPRGYDYDYLDSGTVHQSKVEDGKIVLPSGMSYNILVLPHRKRMTPSLARKIRSLVKAGATVVGIKPTKSPTLADYPSGDKEISSIAGELWGNSEESTAGTRHRFGKGQVYAGDGTQQALEALKLKPDFSYEATGDTNNKDLDVEFIHRKTDKEDIYFISSQADQSIEVNCSFRVTGRKPEIWLPDTGEVIVCEAFNQHAGQTIVPLHLDPYGSLFVVFSKRNKTRSSGIAKSNFPIFNKVKNIETPWKVYFDPKWGGPGQVQMNTLRSWSKDQNKGIRFYSGTATYKKRINISDELIKSGNPLYLDLGVVKEMARVRLNGKKVGTLWKPPFRIKISDAVQPGVNHLEVDIINLWPNRLIGDAALPKEKRYTQVNWNPYKSNSPLLESGLLGPVTLHKSS